MPHIGEANPEEKIAIEEEKGPLLEGSGFKSFSESLFEGNLSFESFSKSLELAKQEALTLQESISRLAEEQTPADVEGIAGDSEQAIKDEDSITEEVQALQVPSANEAQLQIASDQFIELLQTQSEQLEIRRQAEESRISEQFEQRKTEVKAEQKKEFATFRTTLQSLGGFLGPSASASGALINLAVTHRGQLASLEAKKAAAIQAANNAIGDKQFDIARLMAQEAKQIAIDINKSRQDFFDNSLKLLNEEREQQERITSIQNTLRDDARQSLSLITSTFGGIPIDSLPPDILAQLQQIADFAGMPLELFAGPTLKQTAAEATARQREISNAIAAANLVLRERSVALSTASFGLSQERLEREKKISAIEAERLGLPRSVVGLDEDEILEQLRSTTVPQWYIDSQLATNKITEEQLRSGKKGDIEAINNIWNSFRNKVLKSSPIFDFGPIGLAPAAVTIEGGVTD